MAADEQHSVRRTLRQLGYENASNESSFELVKKLLGDLKDLSDQCSTLEAENKSLRNCSDGNGPTFSHDLDETYAGTVLTMASEKIRILSEELGNLRAENSRLKVAQQKSRDLTNAEQTDHVQLNILKESVDALKTAVFSQSDVNATPIHHLTISGLLSELSTLVRTVKSKSSISASVSSENEELKKSVQDLRLEIIKLSDENTLMKLHSSKSTQTETTNLFQEVHEIMQKCEETSSNILCRISELLPQDASNANLSSAEMLIAEIGTELNFATQVSKLNEKLCKMNADQDKIISGLQNQVQNGVKSKQIIETQNAELNRRIDKLSKDLELLNTRSQYLESVSKTDKILISKLTIEKDKAQAAVTSLEASIDSLKAIIRNLRYQESVLQKNMNHSNEKISHLESQLKHSLSLVEELNAQKSASQSDYTIMKNSRDEALRALSTHSQKIQELNTRIDEITRSLNLVQQENESLKKQDSSKKKERDVMMSTHFKLIKSNEKLSLELEGCRNELKTLSTSEQATKSHLKKLESDHHLALSKLNDANQAHESLKRRSALLETEIGSKAKRCIDLETSLNALKIELAGTKESIALAEKTKTENYMQMAKLTSRIAELENLGNRKHEESDNKAFLPEVSHNEGIETQCIREQEKRNKYSDLSMIIDQGLGDESNSDFIFSGDNMAKGIVTDWTRKNQALRNQLQSIRDELKNDVSFALTDNISFDSATDAGQFPESSKRRAESEHQILVDIISRVKSDFQKAALTSPSLIS